MIIQLYNRKITYYSMAEYYYSIDEYIATFKLIFFQCGDKKKYAILCDYAARMVQNIN